VKRVTVHALETVCWIARLGSFTAAAVRLHTTQPAISARVRDLEGILGIRIFQRRGRGVELTIEGRALLDKAEPLYRQIEEFVLFVDLASTFEGTLRIGAGNICMSWFPALVLRLSAEMPRLHVDVDVGNAERLLEGLDSGRLDVAIVSGSVDPGRYSSRSLGFERMLWVCAPPMKVRVQAQGNSLSVPDGVPIWCVPRSSFFHARAIANLRLNGSTRPPINTINNMSAAADLVANGAGIGLLPETLISGLLSDGRLVPVSDSLSHEPVEFFVSCPRQDEPQLLVARVMELACAVSTFAKAV
jgi:DNA-binding transcriptional LysR family regulator